MRVLKAVQQHFRNYHLKSGVFHFYRGEHGPAAEHLTRALAEEASEDGPERRSALYYLVQTRIGAATKYQAEGEPDRAIEEYERAIEVMPGYPDVHFRLGTLLRGQDRLAEAATHLKRAVEANPRYVEALVELGFVSLSLEDDETATDCFRRATEARRMRLATEIDAAEASLSTGDRDVARDIYTDAFLSDLSQFRALFDRALEDLRSERWEDAAEHLLAASHVCPRYADVHNYLGVALAESGHGGEAIAAFERSVGINEDYVVAWLNLAYVAFDEGDVERAKVALGRVLENQPDDAPALALAEALSLRDAPEKVRAAAEERS